MGDIDLLLELRGDQKANAQLGQTAKAVAGVEKATAQSNKVFGVFNSQLNNGAVASALARAGFTELGASLSALPILLNPVSLGITAFAGLAAVIWKTAAASEAQKKLRLDQEMKLIADATAKATVAWDAYYAALAGGSTKREAAIARDRTFLQNDFEKQKADLEKRLRVQLETQNILAARFEAATPGSFEQEEAQRQIDGNTERILNLRQELEDLASSTGRVNQGFKDETASLKSLNDEYLRHIDLLLKVPKQFGSGQTFDPNDSFGFGLGRTLDLTEPEEEQETDFSFLDIPKGLGDISTGATLAAVETEMAADIMGDAFDRMGHSAQHALADTAVGAFDVYADALDETIALNSIFAGGFDRAMRNMLASSLRSVGQRAAVDALYELAAAAASFARYDAVSGSAHLRAAGMFGAVAAVAGVAAGAASVNPGGGVGGSGGRLAGSDRDTGARAGSGPTIQLTIVGNLDASSRESLVRQLREEIQGRDL